MITKETAREIYNCYQQIEEIDKIKGGMVEEIERIRKKREQDIDPIPEVDNCGSFGKYGKGMQLGIPDSNGYSSMRLFSISPSIALMVMDEQRDNLNKKLRELEVVAKLEMSIQLNEKKGDLND